MCYELLVKDYGLGLKRVTCMCCNCVYVQLLRCTSMEC